MSDVLRLPTFSDLSWDKYSKEQSSPFSNLSDEIRKTINDESSKCYEDFLLKQTMNSFFVLRNGSFIANTKTQE